MMIVKVSRQSTHILFCFICYSLIVWTLQSVVFPHKQKFRGFLVSIQFSFGEFEIAALFTLQQVFFF